VETTCAINRTEILARLGGDEELFDEIVQMYFEDYPELLSQIRRAIDQSNAPRLTQSAHHLKGLLSNFSSASATAAVQALEQAGRKNDLEEAPQRLRILESELSALSRTLEEWTHRR
jgi:HPt (histidine-containing phosphotransfer) domain-containing protein